MTTSVSLWGNSIWEILSLFKSRGITGILILPISNKHRASYVPFWLRSKYAKRACLLKKMIISYFCMYHIYKADGTTAFSSWKINIFWWAGRKTSIFVRERLNTSRRIKVKNTHEASLKVWFRLTSQQLGRLKLLKSF